MSGKHSSCAPFFRRVAVISCAENWFIAGKSVRVNPAETDQDHPNGMTMNDKLNSVMVASLKVAQQRAEAKGFRPLRKDACFARPIHTSGQTEDERLTACHYFDA